MLAVHRVGIVYLISGRSGMSAHLNPFKVGVILATVTGGFHLCWSMLVAFGWAQPVIDFVFWAHFIKPIYVIEPFEFVRAAALLVLTTSIGFILGLVFAWMWNALHRRRADPADATSQSWQLIVKG
jgi:hypothetical protein